MPVAHRWSEAEARAAVARYAEQGVAEDLALRTYSARLLGADPELVLHGGGNTSVKTRVRGLLGEEIPVLCVKGSGWDLGSIEPPGHPAVRLEPLQALRALESLSDEDMVAAQRQNLIDPSAPNPSVEALLHAFLPHRFIDHTHATALLALADQPEAEALCREVYGDQVVLVPYVMPGFALARACADRFEAAADGAGADSPLQGMVLLRHGLFSFGASAEESYGRMIELVQRAERHLARGRLLVQTVALPPRPLPAAVLLPRLRGALGRAAASCGAPRHWQLDLRRGADALAVVNDARLGEWALRGVATPDHVIRTKAQPLVLPPCPASADATALETWQQEVAGALEQYLQAYRAMFERQNRRVGGHKRMLDPLPRLLALPGLGLIGIGRSAAEAAVTADIGETWARTLLAAESIGRFEPVNEDDTFDMEYWSLEQAKLGKAREKPLARRVVLVTGGGGAIGRATAQAFAARGADLVVLDRDEASAQETARACGGRALALACDVTDPGQVRQAMARLCERFGGLDIVVSNAGAAWSGPIATLPEAELRACFELNFFAHQSVAQAAVAVFQAQGLGGQLLFNISKQALNPGADFGAYGTSKAALLALMRQYALELGGQGIRVNGLNADRIRSGLLNEAMIRERAAARGTSEEAYMAGNLLGAEVRASDVAEAFVALAMMERTSGALLTVDGGNVAAMVR
ncbi:MAG: bifunctional aldolase/short-chain dehydrogenase [Synechococcaceae cyanobacterium]|nr:bifunctional aldolase/short-chain dehydrogenase [Synechococcaceae cyanobacterium]